MNIKQYKNMMRVKKNLEISIHFYETKERNRAVMKDSFSDLSRWFNYEYSKILLNALNSDIDAFHKIYVTSKWNGPFHEWPKIRMKACSAASNMRTLKVSELTKDEQIKARVLVKELIGDYLKIAEKGFA